MKRVIAIAFSDLHINLWNKFNKDNKRTLDHFRVLLKIYKLCKKYNCPALFCGDLFHKPEMSENELMDLLSENKYGFTDEFGLKHIYAISGNHDMSKTNSIDKPSPSWVKFLDSIGYLYCIDFDSTEITKGVMVYGIPYLDHNIGLNDYIKKVELDKTKKNILMLHSDYPGAKDNDGMEIGSVENLNINLLSKFDLVLMGHIHKPQRLSKKVYMLGAPLHQRRTDRGSKLGCYLIYEDLTLEFKHLKGFPEFIDVESEDQVKDDGNYYTVIKKPLEVSEKTYKTISKEFSKKKIVRLYLKNQGIKDKSKKKVLLDIIKETEND